MHNRKMCSPTTSVDVLIVGAGPAGAPLACFLDSHGIAGTILSRDSSTAFQPQAHYTNPATFECLRDIGLEDEFRRVGLSKDFYGDYRFYDSPAGKEIGSMHSFINRPNYLVSFHNSAVSPY